MTEEKPIRKVTSAWLADQANRWTRPVPVPAPPAPPAQPASDVPAAPVYTAVQQALLTALDKLGGAAHVTELEEKMDASGRMVIDVAHSLKKVVRVTRDRDSHGQPLMVERRKDAA